MLYRRIAWGLAILLFMALVAWWFFLDPGWNVGYASPGKRLFVVLATFLVISLIPATMLALMVALVPRKGRPYGARLGQRLPWCLIVWFGLMGATYALPRFNEWQDEGFCRLIGAGIDDVSVPADLQCEAVHEGHFHAGGYALVRTGARQAEVSPKGEISEFTITWTTTCAYELVKESEAGTRRQVKIVDMRKDWYDCVIGDSTTCALIRVSIDR